MHRPGFVLLTCLALLLCTSPVVRGGEERDTAQAAPERRTYSYGPLKRQRLTAYSDADPARPGPRRTGLVIVHGGFWYQDRSAGWSRWGRRIAAGGPAVFNLDYRRNTEAPWPAQRSDVLRAVNWIKERAGDFGVDPNRIVLLGSSAGGQVATSAGAYGQGRRNLAGVVALSPVVDPYRSWRTAAAPDGDSRGMAVLRANAARLAGCEPQRQGSAHGDGACLRVWRDMSAVRHASGADDPPMLLIHSRRDFVPVAHSEALRDAELRRGMAPGDVTVVTVPGAEHGGGLLGRPGVERMMLNWVAARTQSAAPTPSASPDAGTHG
ncbi:alpha/beta hydrolase [Streptomyces sp. WMMB 322]|uniref:alpha/beta hydrolase n=1 Tax=Streptomyces sp. WMMB 322 TaxID=1286821 RepID=UPI0006E2A588|nr:alpha/beta hydrolase [Streptomyces sp. WMMB 322]SCK11129.1 Acetyl esterase/lipase [Streptomyces sp. WMMB 322]